MDERPESMLLVVRVTAGESSCQALRWNTHTFALEEAAG